MKEGDDDEEGEKPRTPKLNGDFEDDRGDPPSSSLAESNEEQGSSENMLQTSDDRKLPSGNGNNSNRASQPGAVAVKGPQTVGEEPSIDSVDSADNNGKESVDDGDDNDLQIDNRTKVTTTPPTIARMPQSAEISKENVTRQQEQQRPAPVVTAPASPTTTTTTTTNHQENQLEGAVVEDGVTPMVEAELVAPPVEALYVSIDEENATCHLSPLEIGDSNEGQAQQDIRAGMRHKNYKVFVSILLVALIICAISVPVVLLNSDDSEVTVEGTENNENENITTPTQAPTYPYPCYTSTFDILNSQRFDLEIPDAYIICPNTLIEVGTFDNPAIDSYHFVDGDYPIMVIRENVTIQCGIDGKSSNNCVLDGGFIQVLTVQVVPTLDGGFNVSKPVDNMLIRGFTFTGQPINAGPFMGNSVTLSHPGNNIRFEDCRWTDFSAQAGLIGVYRNYFQVLVDLPLAKQSIHATFFNCTFEDIIYDLPLIHTEGHTVSLEQCLFKNIELSLLLQGFCRGGNFDVEMTLFEEGCAGLLFCGPGSSCSIKDICIDDFEYKSPAVVLVTDDSDFVYENLFMLDNTEVAQHTGCELGVAQVNNSLAVECVQIFSPETTCPLL